MKQVPRTLVLGVAVLTLATLVVTAQRHAPAPTTAPTPQAAASTPEPTDSAPPVEPAPRYLPSTKAGPGAGRLVIEVLGGPAVIEGAPDGMLGTARPDDDATTP